MGRSRIGAACAAALCLLLGGPGAVEAAEWQNWRGPRHDGVSPETGLISSWSVAGENLIWRDDFAGRSTAAVFDGRACAIGRDGEGILRQEIVACWDAGDGERLWEWRSTPHNTFVPWQRLGWAAVAGDRETGYLFAHTSDGVLVALDRDGGTVWQWRLGEDIGRLSGYGGRTHTPIVDEDRVILAAINSSWGDQDGPSSMRTWAFDKRTGEVLFAAKPSPRTRDANTQSTPIVAVIDGQRLLIGASSDGSVYAVRARTGEKVWGFQLSKVSLNAGVATDGKRVFASHSEENYDVSTMGRMVAIDATRRGDDITTEGELWRIPGMLAGFGTPLVHGGRVYQLDNSANLYAIDAASGEVKWVQSLGTVGKSGPVWADGKIYVTEVNGKMHILRDAGDRAEMLSTVELKMPDGSRPAEIYASPAIAYGRIYFATEEGFYCLGDPTREFEVTADPALDLGEAPPAPDAAPALIQVVPAEVVTATDQKPAFRVRVFDDTGHLLGERPATSWSLDGLEGSVSAAGELTLEPVHGINQGYVVARLGELEGRARVRAAGPLPWREDFEGLTAAPFPNGGFPETWIGGKKTHVEEKHGNNVLVQPDPEFFAPRSVIYLGPSLMSGYTIQADLYATSQGRRKPEIGLINSGYTMFLAGVQQRLQVHSWGSELRMMQRRDFAWDTETWYTMKLRVDVEPDGAGGERAAIRGKVWKRTEDEPADWTFTVHDPLPIRAGAPGLYAFTPVDAWFDNVHLTASAPLNE